MSRRRRSAETVRIAQLLERLAEAYPEARCSLDFTTPWELLVATILSAQCTDVRVNQVTPALWERFPDLESWAAAPVEEIEALIKPTGFFRNKAHAIQSCAQQIGEQFCGQVPATLEELTALPGIGRKTANVILGNAFGVPGIAVDTHVQRLSRRLGLTTQKEPPKIEQDLMRIVPPTDWAIFSHRLIAHGRSVCSARRPRCTECVLAGSCLRVGVE